MRKKVHVLILTLFLTLFAGSIAVHAANRFSINIKTATVNIGDVDNKLELEINDLSENDRKPRWFSWNENVATVHQDGDIGVVTALRKGKAVISSGIGFPRETCLVTVVEPSIKLDKTTATLYCAPPAQENGNAVPATNTVGGNTLQLKASVKGAGSDVKWSSSNDAVATVEKGTVQAKCAGTAVITATANGKTSSCNITVLNNRISLNIGKMQLSTKGTGSSIKLVPAVIGANKKITWASDAPQVADVKSGKVTGKSAGTAKITATANGVTAECEVTVTENLISINEERAVLYITKTGTEVTNAEKIQLKTNAAKGATVEWSSNNEAVAKIDSNGLVTAVGTGKATITVKNSENPDKMDTCEVEVKDTETLIGEKVVHLKTKGTAKTYVLDYNVIGRKNAVTWKSSNTKVAAVSKGKITAKKPGTAVITATANGVEDTVSVTVEEFTPTITLNQSEYTLYTGKGNTVTLKAAIDGANKKAEWKSSNEDVAIVVANGKVTAIAEGRAQITATANGVAAKCWIRVRESKVNIEKKYYTLGKGDTEELSIDIVGASQSVKYATSNSKAVTVKKGVITAKNIGEADIQITANGETSKCHVFVTDCEKHEWKPVPEAEQKKDDREAGCEECGLATYVCAKCGGKKQDVTNPLGHNFGRWMMEVKATENSAGLEKQVCSRCGAENTRTIPAKSTTGDIGSYEKGELVWSDEFDTLNLNDWNFEYHEPGWVNAELQEYGDSDKNTYVKDGKLYIQALKEMRDGKAYYTSGRINTQGKHDFQYGRFEVRAKVPSGKGFLPAFWMMPTNESYYGQWPKCGEIDIMEVHGSSLDTSYSTLHFGEPHTQKQGSYTLPAGEKNFYEEFHVFACEWDPGEFRFYVDDVLAYTVNDWFTQKPGFGKIAYPAPYDQPFYMILNLAVGGSWVGYPEENDVFEENAQFVIDYVRVYQKDHYDMDVDRPESVVQLRDPDETGNYIINGDFSEVEDLTKETSNWRLLFAEGGEATAEISDNALHIKSTNAGTVNYGVQLVQANLPMENGAKYKLTYDAWADEARTMITDISAPDRGYIRYLNDSAVELTTEKKKYEHVFDMTGDSDANGRVEFNLGNQGSLATVHITNVRLEKEGSAEKEEKGMLPDGNYVYNGSFDEGNEPGKLRLAYWDWDWNAANCKGTSVSVTNDSIRELKVTVPDTVKALDQVVVNQKPVAISGGKKYIFSFDAYADKAKTIKTELAGNTYDSALTTEKQTFKYEFETPADLNGTEIRFLLGTAGTTYIDNVAVREDSMIVNGDFSSGMLGYEVYVNDAAKVPAYVVDSLNEKNAFSMDIVDTGTEGWYIQLKQNNIKLEKDKWYKLAFDAKSTTDREIMYALQRDGTSDDNWTPYSGEPKAALTKDYQNFATIFKMDYDTDPNTVLSISMGAVGGNRVSEKHTVVIDNITLEETEPQEEPVPDAGIELIQNGDFAAGDEGWESFVGEGGEAEVSFAEEKAVYQIANVGNEDWSIQLKHKEPLTLEKGASYQVKMKIKSTESRTVKYAFLNPAYKWYGGEDLSLTAGELKEVNYTLNVTEDTNNKITFVISMGQIAGEDTLASTIEIDDISVIKTSGGADVPDEPDDPVAIGTDLIKNGNFAEGKTDWSDYIHTAGGAEAKTTFENNKARYEIMKAGEEDWNVQLKQEGLKMEKDASYKVNFKIASSIDRDVRLAFMGDGDAWCGGADIHLTKDKLKSFSQIVTLNDDYTSGTIAFQISMGQLGDTKLAAHAVEISGISVTKVEDGTTADAETEEDMIVTPPNGGEEEPDDPIVAIGTELIKNGNFAAGEENWTKAVTAPGEAEVSFADKKAVFNITNVGDEDWNVQLKQSGLTLEKGASYKVNLKIKSTEARTVKTALLDPEHNYKWYGGVDIALNANRQKSISRIVKVDEDIVSTIDFVISMGKIEGKETPASTIEIDDISITKVESDAKADKETEEPDPTKPEEPDDPVVEIGTELIQNGNFEEGKEGWESYIGDGGEATDSFSDGKAVYEITNVGDEDYSVQLKQSGLKLEKGATYKLNLKIKSTESRNVKVSLLDPENGYDWYGGADIELNADRQKSISRIIEVGEDKATSSTIAFQISMGTIEGKETPASTIEIDDISITKVESGAQADEETEEPEPANEDEPSTISGKKTENETDKNNQETDEQETTEQTEESSEDDESETEEESSEDEETSKDNEFVTEEDTE